jgi:hypothetical protein
VAVEATDALVADVVTVVELDRLIDGIELVGRIRGPCEAKEKHGYSHGTGNAEPEARAYDGVRPYGKERGHPR